MTVLLSRSGGAVAPLTVVPPAGTPNPPATTIVEIDTRWKHQGACNGAEQDVFFPSKSGSNTEAKAICAGCPVRAECLEYALRLNIQHGIWGGLSIHERREIRKQRYRASLASTSEPAAHGSGVVPSVARSSAGFAPPASQAPRATP